MKCGEGENRLLMLCFSQFNQFILIYDVLDVIYVLFINEDVPVRNSALYLTQSPCLSFVQIISIGFGL